jgi:CheY-like chemotaxis protein
MSLPRIVVGDDDRHVLNFVELLLRRDFDVVRAADGKQVLERVNGELPALVLLDSRMPEMSGLETLRLLRADPSTRTLPVFLMSSDRTPVFRRKVLAAGANGFLAKPFTAKGLRTLLQSGRGVGAPAASVAPSETDVPA